jgi:hypothetical protein
LELSIDKDKFAHFSSKQTLYLEVVDLEQYIAGEAQKIRMTCDVSHASYFIAKQKLVMM